MTPVSSVPPDLRPKSSSAQKIIKKPAVDAMGGLSPGLRTGDVSLMKFLSSIFGAPKSADELGKTASGYVSSQVNPLIDNLTSEATKHVQAGSQAIKGVYDDYAGRMGAIGDTVRKDNTAAQDAEKAAGGSLRDFLGAQGATEAAGVSSKIGAGAPEGSALANAAAATAAGVGAMGKGIAGESAARGYTGLSELIGHGNAAETHADQLPGLARLEGLSTEHGFTGQVQGDLKGKTDALLAQIPGMTAQELQTLEGNESTSRNNKASLLASFLGGSLDRNTQAAIAAAGLNKDTANTAIDWTTALGYKTDAQGNPVYDSSGNLIPTEKTVHDASTAAGKGSKAHATALKNLGKARDTATSTVRALATKLSKATLTTALQPVTPSIPSKQGKYKKQGGGFTNDPAQAEQKKGSVSVPAKTYQEIFKLALAQPEVSVLASRYALKPAEVAAIVKAGLAAAGVNPPAPKPAKPVSPQIPVGPTTPGVLGPPAP